MLNQSAENVQIHVQIIEHWNSCVIAQEQCLTEIYLKYFYLRGRSAIFFSSWGMIFGRDVDLYAGCQANRENREFENAPGKTGK